MKIGDGLKKCDKLSKEARTSHEKFHWHWSILAGVTLTIVINFIRDIEQVDEPLKVLVRFAIIFILLSLIFSPLRNLLSISIVSETARYYQLSSMRAVVDTKKERNKTFWRSKIKSFFVDIFALLSILLYILGLILMACVLIESFLN